MYQKNLSIKTNTTSQYYCFKLPFGPFGPLRNMKSIKVLKKNRIQVHTDDINIFVVSFRY